MSSALSSPAVQSLELLSLLTAHQGRFFTEGCEEVLQIFSILKSCRTPQEKTVRFLWEEQERISHKDWQ